MRLRETGQVSHHAEVFGIKADTLVVGDYPNRTDALAVHVKGKQQSLINARRYVSQVAEMTLGM